MKNTKRKELEQIKSLRQSYLKRLLNSDKTETKQIITAVQTLNSLTAINKDLQSKKLINYYKRDSDNIYKNYVIFELMKEKKINRCIG